MFILHLSSEKFIFSQRLLSEKNRADKLIFSKRRLTCKLVASNILKLLCKKAGEFTLLPEAIITHEIR